MRQLASETKHRLVFTIGIVSILCAVVLTARILGPFLSSKTLAYEFQLHRYLTDVADGRIHVARSTTFIVVGDSTASQALPLDDSTTGTARSFAVHNGTTLDSYFLLRRYLKRYQPPPCIVLISVYGAAARHYPERFWSHFVGQNFYSSNELDELYALSSGPHIFPARDFSYPHYRLRVAMETVFNLFDWRTVSDLIFKPYASTEARQHYRRARRSNGSMPWQTGVGKPPPGPTSYQDHLFEDFVVDPVADYAIAQLASIKGTNLLIMNPPISERIRNKKSEEWFSRFKSHMTKTAAKFPNIILSLQEPWLKDIAFQNSTHLGPNGDREFLQSQLPAINACIARPSPPVATPSPLRE
ncbi:MAG: hypothetical protein JNJ49_06675 [Bdellovibrionaceae bacterium]|nr:hypothetical protein [Pseudobdellovibrionaceae bacterium]